MGRAAGGQRMDGSSRFRLIGARTRPMETPLVRTATQWVSQSAGKRRSRQDGVVAQLGERLNGIQEVSGSIPLGSTI